MSFEAFEAVLRELCEAREELGRVYERLSRQTFQFEGLERELKDARAALSKVQRGQPKVTPPLLLADFPFADPMDMAWLACLKGSKVEAVKAVKLGTPDISLRAAIIAVGAFMGLGSPNSTRLALLVNEANNAEKRCGHTDTAREEITRAVSEAARCA